MTSRKIRHWKSFLGTLLLLSVVILLIVLLPVFHLQEIEIDGLLALKPENVIKSSGLTINQHLLSGLGGSPRHILQLRYAEAEKQLISTQPSIRSAVIRMDFPGKIVIEIDERVEVAYLIIPDGCAIIDKDGFLMDILPVPPPDIPIISGLSVTSMTLGQPISVDVPSALNSAISLMGAIIDADRDERTDLEL